GFYFLQLTAFQISTRDFIYDVCSSDLLTLILTVFSVGIALVSILFLSVAVGREGVGVGTRG
ncbi:hypothetical protein, partial [Pseudomonas aeruginosa]|uniref:hypothetical protein n=1 Tax=Pseudomonas aeruginosa TaxID=287 RepID=UPI002117B318